MNDFFKFKEVIIDANVLLLLLMGLYNKRELAKLNYKEEELALLVHQLFQSQKPRTKFISGFNSKR